MMITVVILLALAILYAFGTRVTYRAMVTSHKKECESWEEVCKSRIQFLAVAWPFTFFVMWLSTVSRPVHNYIWYGSFKR